MTEKAEEGTTIGVQLPADASPEHARAQALELTRRVVEQQCGPTSGPTVRGAPTQAMLTFWPEAWTPKPDRFELAPLARGGARVLLEKVGDGPFVAFAVCGGHLALFRREIEARS